MDAWSPAQYLKFEDHRTRPAIDLLARVGNEHPTNVTDLGCGPGNSTELLVARYGSGPVTGMDTSVNMIEAAKKRLPDCIFYEADAATWSPAKPQDVIFANAVLQWLPDHEALFVRLARHLKPGGTLAVQMPDNLDEPSHVSMRMAAADPRWAEKLAKAHGERTTILPANQYWSILKSQSSHVDIWRTTYHHPLRGLNGIVEWFKSTGLLPYLSRLNADEQIAYLERYEELLREHYPVLSDGTVILAFPRIFLIAVR
ncbi:trans-aconitate 2-methyltransferase [Rhizobium sp. CC-YZS058]|uniref:trans-aconitate 2-methyltransferase n=1 Tax=Rhizobium sp. CC-YZS058 TaxID=3042153 RepID=UPI003A4C7032